MNTRATDPAIVTAAAVPLFEARGLVKRYGSFTALNGVDFHINRNEVVRLPGDHGAGKSPLVKLMPGITPPTKGQIFVDGIEKRLNSRADSEAAGIETI